MRIFAFIVSRFQRVFFSFFGFFGVLRSISALVASDGTQLESDNACNYTQGAAKRADSTGGDVFEDFGINGGCGAGADEGGRGIGAVFRCSFDL